MEHLVALLQVILLSLQIFQLAFSFIEEHEPKDKKKSRLRTHKRRLTHGQR